MLFLVIYVWLMFGEPGGIRTPDPWLRRPMLYPTELLTHGYITINIIPQKYSRVNHISRKN